jgi:hypothetical protein
MNLEYRLTLQDYLEANQAHIKSQKLLYFTYWSFAALAILLLALNVTVFFLSGGWSPFDLIFTCLIIAFAIYFNPELLIGQRYALKKVWQSQPSIREPMTLEITEEALTFHSPMFQAVNYWKAYPNFVETKNLFILYLSKQSFNLIPKRAFSSTEQIQEFRELLPRKIVKNS